MNPLLPLLSHFPHSYHTLILIHSIHRGYSSFSTLFSTSNDSSTQTHCVRNQRVDQPSILLAPLLLPPSCRVPFGMFHYPLCSLSVLLFIHLSNRHQHRLGSLYATHAHCTLQDYGLPAIHRRNGTSCVSGWLRLRLFLSLQTNERRRECASRSFHSFHFTIAQYIFLGLYLATLAVVLILYHRSNVVPQYFLSYPLLIQMGVSSSLSLQTHQECLLLASVQ